MSITRDFKLSLVAGRSVPLVINANQYDDGEIWRFTLLDETGQKYSPSTGSIIGLKSDGHIIANAGTVSSTGLVIIPETEQMTAAVGKNFYELLIDDDTHGTANFIVFVEPRPGAGGTPSDSDLAVFQEAIDAAATIGDVVDLVDDVAVLEARMDEFTTLTDGSTTGDAELADIRVGADGTTYPNAGDAVRGQVRQLNGKIEDLKSDLEKVINGDDGVTVLSQSEIIEKYGKYSTNVLYGAFNWLVGKTFPDEIPTNPATNVYAVLIDISDAISLTYPKFRNTSGYGCLLLDAEYKVTRNLPCLTDETGTMATVNIADDEKYFLFGVNRTLANMEWDFTITKEPSEGINDLKEQIDTLDESINTLDENIDGLSEKIDVLQDKIVPEAKLNAEIVGFICYGQSWTMGYDTNAIVSEQRYDNLMLDSGLKNNPATDLNVSATSFAPLAEATTYSSSAQTTKCGETPCTAQTDIVKQLLLSENGISDTDAKYQIFSAAPGMGNKSLEELAYGTDYYNRMIDVVRTANSIARAQGKVFVIPAISWAQGRATSNDATYYDQLEELRLHMDADIKAITGQSIPVKLIAWQAVFGNTTPKRFYDRYVYASEKYENIICSGTFYNYNHKANDNLHLTADSQDWLGCQFGIAYKRSIIDGEKFIPLKPKKTEVYGNIAYLDFYVPVKPLAFDTTLVSSISNYGFQIFDSGNTEKSISSVEIIAPDRIKIVCASDIASTDHIVYGGNGGTDYSPTTGKRGNLRDSQNIVYKNHNNVDLPCYNWCVVFDKTIAELTQTE